MNIVQLAKKLPKLHLLDIVKCPNLPKATSDKTSGGGTAYDKLLQELTEIIPGAIIAFT